MKWATRVQINAIIALLVLGGVTWRLLDIIRINDLEAHESQILGVALASCVGGIVYVARLFASQKENGDGD